MWPVIQKSQKDKKRRALFILGALDRGPKASSDLKLSWKTNLRNTIGRYFERKKIRFYVHKRENFCNIFVAVLYKGSF